MSKHLSVTFQALYQDGFKELFGNHVNPNLMRTMDRDKWNTEYLRYMLAPRSLEV